ncbi:MAG: hypothetical protein HC905_29175 [Bacteroidales bacterium]|nr:hypothetical protein [Bacteroidales bacterium]
MKLVSKYNLKPEKKSEKRSKQHNPELKHHLIWDITELTGVSIFARYELMVKAVISSPYASFNVVGSNTIAKSFIRIINTINPQLKFRFFKTFDEAIRIISKKISVNDNSEFKIKETDYYANFIDLWQKNPEFREVNNYRYKLLQLDQWKYVSPESSYKASYCVLEGNIILFNCEGFIKVQHVENTYRMLEDIMTRIGYDEN